MAEKDFLAVVAIDIGSAFSGYAYQFREDFEKARTKNIYSCVWRNGYQAYEKQFQASCLIQMGVSIPLGKEFWCFYIQVVVFKSVVSNR